MCEICICGKHECPKDYSPVREKIVPTSHLDYKRQKTPEFKTPVKKNFKPYEETHYNNDYLKTTVQRDFTRPNLKPAPADSDFHKFFHRTANKNNETYSRNYSKSPGKFDTEYKQNYPEKNSRLVFNNMRPQSSRVDRNLNFQGNSTYKEDYNRVHVPSNYKASPIRYKDNIIPVKEKQIFESTYNREFSPKPYSKVSKVNMIPQRRTTSPFATTPKKEKNQDYSTSYRKNYQRPESDAYAKPNCPITYLPTRPRYLTPNKSHMQYNEFDNRWD